MHYSFMALGIEPESSRQLGSVAQFAFDYTFYMNIAFLVLGAVLVVLHKRHVRETTSRMNHDKGGSIGAKRIIAFLALLILVAGLAVYLLPACDVNLLCVYMAPPGLKEAAGFLFAR